MKQLEDKFPMKKIRCRHQGCTAVLEVGLYEDEWQYCDYHATQLASAFQHMQQRLKEANH